MLHVPAIGGGGRGGEGAGRRAAAPRVSAAAPLPAAGWARTTLSPRPRSGPERRGHTPEAPGATRELRGGGSRGGCSSRPPRELPGRPAAVPGTGSPSAARAASAGPQGCSRRAGRVSPSIPPGPGGRPLPGVSPSKPAGSFSPPVRFPSTALGAPRRPPAPQLGREGRGAGARAGQEHLLQACSWARGAGRGCLLPRARIAGRERGAEARGGTRPDLGQPSLAITPESRGLESCEGQRAASLGMELLASSPPDSRGKTCLGSLPCVRPRLRSAPTLAWGGGRG